MHTQTILRPLILALLLGATPMLAHAHGGGDGWRGKHHHHHHHRYYDHGPRGYGPPGYVVYEREYVRRPRHIYEERYVYEEPRYYRRSPGIVIGVDIPPLVIPLR